MTCPAWSLIYVTVFVVALHAADSSSSPEASASPSAWSEDRLWSWHYEMLVNGYLKHGQRDAQWDAAATNALGRFAATRAGVLDATSPQARAITSFTAEAIQRDCADPMIRYVHWRRGGKRMSGTTNILEIADDLATTGYDPLLKSYAYLRAFRSLHPEGSTNPVPPEAGRARHLAFANFYQVLERPDLPGDEFLDLAEPLGGLLWNTNLVAQYWPSFEEAITNRHMGMAEAQYVLGDKYVDFAWLARGGGWASTVSDEGWKLFGKRLERGEEALRTSWQLSPSLAQVPMRMIWVCIGRGHPRAEMERWFRQGQTLSSGWYELYQAKVQFLMPKWHGSNREVVQFGRACLTDTNAVKRARLMIVDIHEELERYFREDDPKSGRRSPKVNLSYYRDPVVWKDIRSAFEIFFREWPEATGWHHNFALHAWRAQDWKVLNEQIPLLGEINYRYFGGQAEYERMLAEAKEHAND